MTYNPTCIVAARNYLISRGIPGRYIGIMGDPAHKASGGYHCGCDWLSQIGNLWDDYSRRESPRDRSRTSNAAMALDIGGLNGIELYRLSKFIVDACVRGEPWTHDIREVIYYDPFANVVRRWDRLGQRTTGDRSHRTHTHLSYFRDSEGRDKTELFRRYYEPVKVPAAPALDTDEDEMKPVLFHKAGSTPLVYGLQTETRWVETTDYPVAVRWAQQYGDSTEISAAAYDKVKAQYAPIP